MNEPINKDLIKIIDPVVVNVNQLGPATISYKSFVDTLIKRFNDFRLELAHSAMGVSSEAGELSDAIKRHVIYGNPPDIKNITEELGDLEFYMQDIRTKYCITREQTLVHNVEKLSKRYENLAYSDQAAIFRADKQSDAPTT